MASSDDEFDFQEDDYFVDPNWRSEKFINAVQNDSLFNQKPTLSLSDVKQMLQETTTLSDRKISRLEKESLARKQKSEAKFNALSELAKGFVQDVLLPSTGNKIPGNTINDLFSKYLILLNYPTTSNKYRKILESAGLKYLRSNGSIFYTGFKIRPEVLTNLEEVNNKINTVIKEFPTIPNHNPVAVTSQTPQATMLAK